MQATYRMHKFADINSTETKDIAKVRKIIKNLTPDQARDLGVELGLHLTTVSKMSDKDKFLEVPQAWILGHDSSRDVCGKPTWRAFALACAKQEMWGLVEEIQKRESL